MFYYLYEIRNNLNGKIYVGVHKTKDMNDGYMGSGKVILRAIEKHGIENFTKVIRETFEDSMSMYAREKEVVTDEFLLREDTYNLRRGGHGGFDYINKIGKNKNGRLSKEDRIKSGKITGALNAAKWKEFPLSHPGVFTPKFNKEMSDRARSVAANNKRIQTYKEIGHQQGKKHSQFGTMWITNGVENKKIKKSEPIPKGWRKGRICRPIKII